MTVMRTMGLAPLLPSDATVTERANEYVVSLAVPGFARQELEVEVEDHVLMVRGDQRRTPTDGGSFKLHEHIEESFRLPADADTDRLSATFAHSALEIHAPRASSRSGARKVRIMKRPLWSSDAAAS